eukprot:324334-Chlamydomonas_euryale.AAC.8
MGGGYGVPSTTPGCGGEQGECKKGKMGRKMDRAGQGWVSKGVGGNGEASAGEKRGLATP